MPTVEITQEQQAALDRGENITITPPPPREKHIVVHEDGAVYETRGPLDNAEWRVVRSAPGTVPGFENWNRGRLRFNFTKTPLFTIVPIKE